MPMQGLIRLAEVRFGMQNQPNAQAASQPALHHPHQGQSLMETLFVLFLFAVMCGVAASSMLWVQRKIQMQVAAEDLLNAVLTARTEALRREKRVTLCVAQALPDKVSTALTQDLSDLPVQCDLTPSNVSNSSATWQQGWLMFVDDNSNGLLDSAEVLLQQHKALTTAISATGNSTVNRYISFGANGRSLILNGGFQAGTLTFCEHLAQASPGWLLVINAVGRPRLEKTQVPQCL